MEKNMDDLMFTFEGDHEVNALSVAKAIEGLVEISSVIAERCYPDVEFRLAVKAVTPGSLNFSFQAVAQWAQTLLTASGIQYAKSMMDSIKAMFEIKQFLGGNKLKSKTNSGEHIIIENSNGNKMTIPTSAGVYFIDQRIDNSVSNIMCSALTSPCVTGIKVTRDKGVSVEIPREDFEVCAKKIEVLPQADGKEITFERKNEMLFVRKPDLLGDAQWGFKSDKNFMAEVKDEEFLQRIREGAQGFYAKTYIFADVQVIVGVDEEGVPDESKCRYIVTKVHSTHAPEDLQVCAPNE